MNLGKLSVVAAARKPVYDLHVGAAMLRAKVGVGTEAEAASHRRTNKEARKGEPSTQPPAMAAAAPSSAHRLDGVLKPRPGESTRWRYRSIEPDRRGDRPQPGLISGASAGNRATLCSTLGDTLAETRDAAPTGRAAETRSGTGTTAGKRVRPHGATYWRHVTCPARLLDAPGTPAQKVNEQAARSKKGRAAFLFVTPNAELTGVAADEVKHG